MRARSSCCAADGSRPCGSTPAWRASVRCSAGCWHEAGSCPATRRRHRQQREGKTQMTACRVPQLVSFALAALWVGTTPAETRSVIDPVEAPVPQKPPPAVKDAEELDAALKRERRRAEAAHRSRAS